MGPAPLSDGELAYRSLKVSEAFPLWVHVPPGMNLKECSHLSGSEDFPCGINSFISCGSHSLYTEFTLSEWTFIYKIQSYLLLGNDL